MRGMGQPNKAELQDCAKGLLANLNYSEPMGEQLRRVGLEAEAKLGVECKAWYEVRDNRDTLVVGVRGESGPETVEVTVVSGG